MDSKNTRRYDLDWLRVLALLALFFFHAGMPFVAEWDWHLKNATTSNLFQEWMYLLSRFRMALLFVVAGVGTAYALRSRGNSGFLGERARRLLLPLAFGMLVIVPPQIYFERLAHGVSYGNYLEFWASVFRFETYPAGNFSWHHLWFVAYLFVYSVLALPLFAWLRSPRGSETWQRAAQRLGGSRVFLLGLPIVVAFAALVPHFRGMQNFVDDWGMFSVYFCYFLLGYALTAAPFLWDAIEQQRRHAVQAAIGCLLVMNYVRWNGLEPESLRGVTALLALSAAHGFFWVMALAGYARRYLNRNSPLLAWANEAVYPVYILHQTVIVTLAYYVLPLGDGIGLKFAFLAAASLGLTLLAYEYFIRPYETARLLFGLRPARQRLAGIQAHSVSSSRA
jgi:glucans biosynthesis protein C